MRIAQIVPSLAVRHGGPSRSVLGLSEGLARCGENVELLTTHTVDERPRASSASSPIIRTFLRQPPEVLARSEPLNHHLRTQVFDIIHHHALWLRTLHYAHAAALKSGVPLVISPRGMMSPWAWRHRRWKKNLASWLVHPGAFAGARGWHATCEAEADDIRNLGFTQPICIAPNGVIPPSPNDEAVAKQKWLALLPALAGRRVALFYSRFHAKKRVLELIDLWLSRPRGDWVLLVAGIPEQYSVNQLDAYLVRNGGTGRIVIQDGAELPPPYAVASLFLLPSHSENFGLVVAEALVRGIPALVTDTTPWKELAGRGAGRCVAWDDYGAAINDLIAASSAELAAAGARARTWATAAFSWDKAALTLRAFYQELTATR